MTGEVTNLGTCQVRSETDRPCHRPAVVEIWGIPFCEQCAREQEAYFAIGELTQGSASDRRLAEALDRVRREFDERMAEVGSASAQSTPRHPSKTRSHFSQPRVSGESQAFIRSLRFPYRLPGVGP